MKLKSASVATKLLFLSCLTAVIVVVSIVSVIKLLVLPQMTDKALENQTVSLAYALRGLHATSEQWDESTLSKHQRLDEFSVGGHAVATLFLYKNGQYVRMATTLKNAQGSLAVGSVLDPNSDSAAALAVGRSYTGKTFLFGRQHMATYLPVSLKNGVKGAVFVGIDYASADPMLLLARHIDYIVIGTGVFGVLLLGVGLFFSVRVEEAHREIEDIFRTTQDGLFLLDHELTMGAKTSDVLESVLGFSVRPGARFLDLLKPYVSPKTFDTAKEYVELLLRHDVKEKLVASLNPLDCIEISSVKPNGAIESRFLQIKFNRVRKGGKVTHLLVTAKDITRQVRLERELQESEQRIHDQMGMMVQILQIEPALLQDFISTATNGLNIINEIIRTSNPATGITNEQIEQIARKAHQLKGDATALQLEAISQALHGFETQLAELKARAKRTSEDLLPLTVKMKELFGGLGTIKEVVARITQVRGVVTVEPPKPERQAHVSQMQPFARQWNMFAQQLADRHSKKVELTYLGMNLDQFAPEARESINMIVNQFIRNAIVHGIESPALRQSKGKSETGHISVYLSDQGNGLVELSFRDDGAGIDPEKIRQKLIANGKADEATAKALDVRKLTMMIFEPGFSTVQEANEDAGRGVGLDAVRTRIATDGGKIRVGTTKGEYCHFRVQLPLHLDSTVSVEEVNEPTEEAA